MTLNDYQERTRYTAIYPEIGGKKYLYPIMGLAGEAGELMNKVKKIFRDDQGVISLEKGGQLFDELGDILWYLARTADELGIKFDDIAEYNLDRKEKNTLTGDGDNR